MPERVASGVPRVATLLSILSIASTASACVLSLYWGVALFRMIRTRWCIPTLRYGLKLAERESAWPSLRIVVPAHNEGGHNGRGPITTLVESIRRQDYPDRRLVLGLDRCTDDSLAQAERASAGDPRVRIVPVEQCPEGWAGKVHAIDFAMRSAPEANSAELLLFADADTVFEPGCLRAAVALMRERRVHLLSLLSTLTHDRWFERIDQPVAGLELARQHPLMRVNRQSVASGGAGAGSSRGGRRAFANGQFMLFRRDFYERLGGHAAVKDQLLEDLALARATHDASEFQDGTGAEATGGDIGLFIADGLLRCRMYDSPAAFFEGWKRIYIEAAKRKPSRLTKSSWVVRAFGCVLPAVSVIALVGWLWQSVGGAVTESSIEAPVAATMAWAPHAVALSLFASAVALAYRMGGTPIWCAPLYPIGAWRVGGILASAARALRRRESIRWAGREYVLEPRE